MFSQIQTYLIVGLLVLITVLGGLGYWYFQHSQQQIATLRENAVKLEQAVQTQQHTIQAQQEAQERSNREVLQLQNRLSGAERTRRDLEVRLRQQNLEHQARTRRQDTETEINTQLQSQWRAFETLTGHVSSTTPPPTTAGVTADHQPPPRPPVRGTSR